MKKIKKKIKDVTFSWEGGRYFDLWMMVHTLSGVFIGFLFGFLSIPIFFAFLAVFSLLIFWEILERYFFHIFEAKDNRVIDVVVGIIGFAIAYHWSVRLGLDALVALLIFSAIVLSSLTLLGWLDFRRRRLERMKKIK